MKNLLILFAILCLMSCHKERTYCGPIIERYRTDAGYKSSPEWHVIFYSDSLKRNVDVKVTPNTHANAVVGKRTCYDLFDYQIE